MSCSFALSDADIKLVASMVQISTQVLGALPTTGLGQLKVAPLTTLPLEAQILVFS